MSGTSHGMSDNTIPDAGFPQKTHFDQLQAAGLRCGTARVPPLFLQRCPRVGGVLLCGGPISVVAVACHCAGVRGLSSTGATCGWTPVSVPLRGPILRCPFGSPLPPSPTDPPIPPPPPLVCQCPAKGACHAPFPAQASCCVRRPRSRTALLVGLLRVAAPFCCVCLVGSWNIYYSDNQVGPTAAAVLCLSVAVCFVPVCSHVPRLGCACACAWCPVLFRVALTPPSGKPRLPADKSMCYVLFPRCLCRAFSAFWCVRRCMLCFLLAVDGARLRFPADRGRAEVRVVCEASAGCLAGVAPPGLHAYIPPPPQYTHPHTQPYSPTASLLGPRRATAHRNVFPIEQFAGNVAAGKLAAYTLIEPRMSASVNGSCNWQHPECSVLEVRGAIGVRVFPSPVPPPPSPLLHTRTCPPTNPNPFPFVLTTAPSPAGRALVQVCVRDAACQPPVEQHPVHHQLRRGVCDDHIHSTCVCGWESGDGEDVCAFPPAQVMRHLRAHARHLWAPMAGGRVRSVIEGGRVPCASPPPPHPPYPLRLPSTVGSWTTWPRPPRTSPTRTASTLTTSLSTALAFGCLL